MSRRCTSHREVTRRGHGSLQVPPLPALLARSVENRRPTVSQSRESNCTSPLHLSRHPHCTAAVRRSPKGNGLTRKDSPLCIQHCRGSFLARTPLGRSRNVFSALTAREGVTTVSSGYFTRKGSLSGDSQELRFVLPVLPVGMMTAGLALSRLRRGTARTLTAALVLTQAPLALYLSVRPHTRRFVDSTLRHVMTVSWRGEGHLRDAAGSGYGLACEKYTEYRAISQRRGVYAVICKH